MPDGFDQKDPESSLLDRFPHLREGLLGPEKPTSLKDLINRGLEDSSTVDPVPGVDPVEHTRAAKAGRPFGVSGSTVGKNYQEFERQTQERSQKAKTASSELLQRYPHLRSHFLNPDRAAGGWDDINSIGDVIDVALDATGISDVKRAYASGKANSDRSDLVWSIMSADAAGREVDPEKFKRFERLEKTAASFDPDISASSIIPLVAQQIPNWLAMGKGAVAGGAVGGVLSAATGFSSAPVLIPGGAFAGASLAMGQIEFGSAYFEYRDLTDGAGNKLDPEVAIGMAALYGVAAGTVEAFGATLVGKLSVFAGIAGAAAGAGNKVAANTLIKAAMRKRLALSVKGALQGKSQREIFAKIGKTIIAAMATEGAQEGAQEWLNVAGGTAGKVIQNQIDDSFEDVDVSQELFGQETRARVGHAAATGALVGVGVASASATAGGAAGKLTGKVVSANSTSQKLEKLEKVKANSRLAREDPEAFAAAVETETKDTAPFLVDAGGLLKFFQGEASEISIGEVVEAIPSLTTEKLIEAAEAGLDVTIPFSEFVTYISGTPMIEGFGVHTKERSSDFTVSQLDQLEQDLDEQIELAKQAEPEEGGVEDDFGGAYDLFVADAEEKLLAQGLPAKVAKLTAKVWGAAQFNVAERAGVDPLDEYAGLQVDSKPSRSAVSGLTSDESITSASVIDRSRTLSQDPLTQRSILTGASGLSDIALTISPPTSRIDPQRSEVSQAASSSGVATLDSSSGKKILHAPGPIEAAGGTKEQTVQELAARAREHKEKIDALVAGAIAPVRGAEIIGSRAKTVKPGDRIWDKVAHRPPRTLGDYHGSRVAVDSETNVADVLEALQEVGPLIDIDNFLGPARRESGHSAVHAQVYVEDLGFAIEVQIATPQMLAAVNTNHKDYEELRGDLGDVTAVRVAFLEARIKDEFRAAQARQNVAESEAQGVELLQGPVRSFADGWAFPDRWHEITVASRKYLNWSPPRTKDGKYKGAPEWVNKPSDLKKMRKQIKQLVREGAVGRYWYEKSAAKVLEVTNGRVEDAEKLIQLIAIYSPQAEVWVNTMIAVRAYRQWKNGVSSKDFYAQGETKDNKARDILYEGKHWKGRKTDTFYRNLVSVLLDGMTDEQRAEHIEKFGLSPDFLEDIRSPVTSDLWVFRAYGYLVHAGTDDKKGSGKYSFTENDIRRLTAELNQDLPPGREPFLPRQVQAMLWTGVKTRWYTPSVVEKTKNESVAAGYSSWEGAPGGRWNRPPTRASEKLHNKVWEKNALSKSVTSAQITEAAERDAFDFSDTLSRMSQIATWETIVSASLGHPINDAPLATRGQFTRDAMSIILDPFGNDKLAALLGEPINWTVQGVGAYEGNLNPNVVSSLMPNKPVGEFDYDSIRAYTRALQYIFKQDAVPWIRLDPKIPTEGQYRVTKPDGTAVSGGAGFDTFEEAKAFADSQALRVQFRVLEKSGKTVPKSGVVETREAADKVVVKGEDRRVAFVVTRNGKAVGKHHDTQESAQAAVETLQPTITPANSLLTTGVKFQFLEPLTEERKEQFLARLTEYVGEGAAYTQVGPRTLVAMNFRDSETGQPFAAADKEFGQGIAAMVNDHYVEELDAAQTGQINAESEYGEVHDWGEDPEGEAVRAQSSFPSGSDIQSRLRGWRTEFEKILDDYAAKSGQELDPPVQEAIESRFEQPAFHGTPHRFDKFTLDHIGTGEGVQAFGWGLYFAESEDVARFYKESLAARGVETAVRYKGKDFAAAGLDRAEMHALDTLETSASHRVAAERDMTGVVQEALGVLRDSAETLRPGWQRDRYIAAAGALERMDKGGLISVEAPNAGQLIEVDIPESSDLLDYDKPLSEQPEGVGQALERAGIAPYSAAKKLSKAKTVTEKSAITVELQEQSWTGVAVGQPFDIGGRELLGSLQRHFVDQGLRRGTQAQGAASRALLAAGIPGLKYFDGTSRTDQEGTSNFVVWDEEAIEVLRTFRQPARASVGIAESGELFVNLGKASDFSSALHEFSHGFLDKLRRTGAALPADHQINQDLDTTRRWLHENAKGILKWVKDNDGGQLAAGSYDEVMDRGGLEFIEAQALTTTFEVDGDLAETAATTSFHEYFARGSELYLSEGVAPSSQLKEVFRAFTDWMVNIYGDVKAALGVNLNDEIRGVLDRLVASDEQIEAAQQERVSDLRNLESSLDLTEAQATRVQDARVSAAQSARDEIRRKAYNRAIAERKALEAKTRPEVEAQVRREIGDRPSYKALEYTKSQKLHRPTLLEYVTPELASAASRLSSPEGPTLPEELAGRYGFLSIPEMIETIVGLEPLEEAVKKETDRVLLERLGPPAIEETVQSTLESAEGREAVLKAELEAIAAQRAVGSAAGLRVAEEGARTPAQQKADLDAAQAALDAAVTPEEIEAATVELARLRAETAPAAQERRSGAARKRQEASVRATVREQSAELKALAEARVARMKASEIRPELFLRAQDTARREADRALRARKYDEALEHQRRRLLLHYAHKAAVKGQKTIKRARKTAKSFQKAATQKAIGSSLPSALAQVNSLLLRAGLLGSRIQSRANVQPDTLASWLDTREKAGDEIGGFDPLMTGHIPQFEGMTLDQVEAFDQTLRALRDLAKRSDEITIAGETHKLGDVIDRIVAAIEENGGKVPGGKDRNPSDISLMKEGLQAFDASLIKMEQIIDWLDGGEIEGPMREFVFMQISAAQAMEGDLQREVPHKIIEAFEGISKESQKHMQTKVFVPEVDTSFVVEDIMAVALNMGSGGKNGNYQKMQRGENWTEEQIDAVVAHLNDEEWAVVQTIWDTLEELGQQLFDVHEQATGIRPKAIEHRTFTTPSGMEMRGGYYPIVYDPRRSKKAEKNWESKNAPVFENNLVKHETTSGATIGRTGFAEPILFQLSILPSHISEVIHDVTHRAAINNIYRVVSNPRFEKAMDETMGTPYRKMFLPWLQSVANDRTALNEELRVWNRAFRRLRTNVAVMAMGLKATTAVSQIAGISAGMGRAIEAGYKTELLNQIRKTGTHPWQSYQYAIEKSGEMRNRSGNLDRDLRDAMRRVAGHNGVLSKSQQFAFHGMAIADMMVTVPIWHAGYNAALKQGLSEKEAIEFGDREVRLSQGAGGAKDLSAVQRGNEFFKLFTNFYSYLAALYSQIRDTNHQIKSIGDVPQAMAKYFFYVTLSAVMADTLSNRGPDEEEGEGWLEFALWKSALLPFMTIPGVRELAATVESGRQFQLSPTANVGKSAKRLLDHAADAFDDDADFDPLQLGSDAFEFMGYMIGLPVNQVNITYDNVRAVIFDGADYNLWDILFYQKKED